VTFHLDGLCFIEIEGQLRQYEVIAVTPHLVLRQVDTIAVRTEPTPE
jgi:hypothetical protein